MYQVFGIHLLIYIVVGPNPGEGRLSSSFFFKRDLFKLNLGLKFLNRFYLQDFFYF